MIKLLLGKTLENCNSKIRSGRISQSMMRWAAVKWKMIRSQMENDPQSNVDLFLLSSMAHYFFSCQSLTEEWIPRRARFCHKNCPFWSFAMLCFVVTKCFCWAVDLLRKLKSTFVFKYSFILSRKVVSVLQLTRLSCYIFFDQFLKITARLRTSLGSEIQKCHNVHLLPAMEILYIT